MSVAVQQQQQEPPQQVKSTPMMRQWKECKEQSKGALLLFRLGDFYEAFYEDAEIAAKELELTLTQRQDVPMCGIPWHASEAYIERLVSKGYRVAIAEQMEDPKKAKGLVTRKLTRVLSPGTYVPGAYVSPTTKEKTHSFIASLSWADERFGFACIDIATATFTVFECGTSKELLVEIFRQQPKEFIVGRRFASKYQALIDEITRTNKTTFSSHEDWLFDPIQAQEKLCEHFRVGTLDGFGLKGMSVGITSAGALLQYLKEWLLAPLDHLVQVRPACPSDRLRLDRATLVNLEILESSGKNSEQNSLLSLLDETKTAMGARLLPQWLKNPLTDLSQIRERQDAVAELVNLSLERPDVMSCFDEKLQQIRDLERQIFRIKTRAAGPSEYVSLRTSLEQLPGIKEVLKGCSSRRLETLYHKIDPLIDCVKLIRDALVDESPLRLSDGNAFRPGFCQELDERRAFRTNSQEWLVEYQNQLRQETGIKNLKVGFNRMFGYYIEISRGQIDKVPPSLERKQTLVNAERYVSPELKGYEEKVLTADARITELEEELFAQLRAQVAEWHQKILQSAEAIAELDVLRSLSIVAKERGYICPCVDQTSVLWIRGGRHPVIETIPSPTRFVPNDIYLDGENHALMCITGPNMAGKSTFIRQVALLVIMAQIGSFIPAEEARIGIVDQVFSRIGASDDLARGQSTFMVEMAETASILNLATRRSLVILDEIGRGTSTYDGISIAWAVAEYLINGPRGRPKTLFATHYYELTALETHLPGVVNYTVSVTETADGVQFLRKVLAGKTDKSFGIHVARLAGMPDEVINRAKECLIQLEQKEVEEREDPNTVIEKEVLTELSRLDVNAISPINMVLFVSELQKKLLTNGIIFEKEKVV